VDAVEEPAFLLELLVMVREFAFSSEVITYLLDTWLAKYPAHPITIDTRARLLLEKVGPVQVSFFLKKS
jgi:hypothetical protein